MKLAIENASILTMNEEREIIPHGHLLIEDHKIVAIGREAFKEADQRIDASGQVLMPGLINLHCHSSMSLLRNIGNDTNLQDWLNDHIFPLEAHLTREIIQQGTRLNILEMLRTGTTHFVDMYFEMDAIGQVVEEMGIRAVLTRGLTEDSNIENEEVWLKEWNGAAHDRIRTMVGVHSIYATGLEALKKFKALADRVQLPINIHVSETKTEVEDSLERYGKSPVALLDELGYLDQGTIAAHCVWLSEEDMDILAQRGVNCSYNPASNMKLASGFMPLEALLARGVNVGLGTDGASSNNRQDMFADMRLGSFIQKGYQLDPTAAKARTMLELATINGAKAIGREDELGSLEVGKLADMILVDFNNVHHTPVEDIEAALIYSTNGLDVSTVIVDGRILVEDGKIKGVDEEKIRQEAQEAIDYLKAEEGIS